MDGTNLASLQIELILELTSPERTVLYELEGAERALPITDVAAAFREMFAAVSMVRVHTLHECLRFEIAEKVRRRHFARACVPETGAAGCADVTPEQA